MVVISCVIGYLFVGVWVAVAFDVYGQFESYSRNFDIFLAVSFWPLVILFWVLVGSMIGIGWSLEKLVTRITKNIKGE